MQIRDRIKKILEEKGWTVYKLSKKSGIAQSTLSDILNGKNKNPNLDTLEKISNALGVFIHTLTEESASSIIEERLDELNMTYEEIAKKANVPLQWLKNLDSYIPGQSGGLGYEWITKVAEILDMPSSMLRAALARQEVPNQDESDLKNETLYSSFDDSNFTVKENTESYLFEKDEDMKRIERARNMMSPKDKKKMMDILKISFEEYFNDESN